MKTVLFISTLMISIASFGQTEKQFYKNGQLNIEIIQLDKIPDANRHVICYYENGNKREEFFDKNKIVYDTLKQWTETGQLYRIELHNDNGYTTIAYYPTNGKISEIGNYILKTPTIEKIIIYDSTTFNKFEMTSLDNDHYVRSGIWKTYYENGILESEGEYLPPPYYTTDRMKDSSGASVYTPKTSFEPIPDELYVRAITYLKKGHWIYYDIFGVKSREEFYINGIKK